MVITSGKIAVGGGLRFGTLLLILSMAPTVWALDGGHHFDLTRDALVTLGVPQDRDAIKVVQIQNVYCDLWEQANTVIDRALEYSWLVLPAAVAGIWHLIFYPPEVRELSNRYLHFDDLSNYDEVEQEWNRLLINTYEAVQKARRDNDPMGLLTLLGISLHKLQDFYAHSNWSHIDWDGDATWFDVPDTTRRALARLPAYDIYTTGRPGCGHDILNKDHPSRPGFDKAYREAFYASVQWAKRVKDWAGEALWNRAMGSEGPVNTDLEYHFARYLHWYAATWKGPGLEEERSRDDLVVLSLAYTDLEISSLRESSFLSKWKEYCYILTSRPRRSRADYPARTFEMTYPERRKWLKLEITEARQTDNDWIWDIDPGGDADFYTVVTVNGIAYLSGMYEDRDRVEFRSSPPYPSTWVTLVPLSVATPRVSVQVKLVDEDCVGGGALPSIRGNDDVCDINHHLDMKTWDHEFTVAELARRQYIETDGFRYGAAWYESDGDGDEAKVKFNMAISEPPRGGRPPVIRSVNPPEATVGCYSSITISGENFYPSASIHFGPDIRVHAYRIVSEQEIQVTILTPVTATPGVRACSVKTRCGSAAAPFSVTPPPPAAPTSVTPSSCPKGASADVVIEGDNISPYDVEWVSFGGGISVLGQPRVFEIRSGVLAIRATIRISPEAPTGVRDVTVKQRLKEPGIGRGLFMVTEPPHTGPLITTVYPSTAEQGESLQVTIRGLGLTDVVNVHFGPDIAVRRFSEVVEYWGRPPYGRIIKPGDAIEAFIAIPPLAPVGDRMVTVSTRGGGRANGVFRVTVRLR